MVVLALDTTTRTGSVALARGETTLASQRGDPARTHGERLPLDIVDVLGGAGMTFSDVEVYAVCSGPGSFTGLRVGLATIQGLALATSCPVAPVPTLEALAYAGLWSCPDLGSDRPAIIPWMDAQRGEVFAGVYVTDGDGRIVPRGEPTAGPLSGVRQLVADRIGEGPVIVVGETTEAASDIVPERRDVRALAASTLPCLAEIVARVAGSMPPASLVAPHAIRPIYVRRSDAELARERRAVSGHGASAAGHPYPVC